MCHSLLIPPPNLISLQVFNRVERTFCCGLQSADPRTRQKVGSGPLGWVPPLAVQMGRGSTAVAQERLWVGRR